MFFVINTPLAVIAVSEMRRGNRSPDESGGGRSHRMVMPLVTIVGTAENVHFDVFRIGGRPQFANIVSRLSSRGPEVTVGADVAIHVEVVEQDELPRQSVLIGCYSLAEEHQVRL